MTPDRIHQEQLLHIWRQGFRRARHPIHNLREIRKILIVKPSSLGDVVHGLPVLSALRANFPRAQISWLVKKEFAPILAGADGLYQVIVWDRGHWKTPREGWESLKEFGRCLKDVELTGFDLVIDLQGLFRSGLMVFATGAPVRVGFSSARELSHKFYNIKVDVPSVPLHAVDRYLFIVDRLHLERVPVSFGLTPDDAAREAVRTRILKRLGTGGPLVAVAPSARWVSKEWSARGFGEVAGELRRAYGARIVLVGTRAERERAGAVRGHLNGRALNAAGQTSLAELIALLSEADLFITNDSGPMHIADALGTPLVAVFGPTDAARTGPYRQRRNVVTAADCACAPCLRRYCTNRECMRDVSAKAVLDVAVRLLDRKPDA